MLLALLDAVEVSPLLFGHWPVKPHSHQVRIAANGVEGRPQLGAVSGQELTLAWFSAASASARADSASERAFALGPGAARPHGQRVCGMSSPGKRRACR